MKRLALFSFYNKSGRVNSYVFYYLASLSKYAETVFIVNGDLLPESGKKLEAEGYAIFQRENKGFDFGAWKDFILSKESSFFSQYDEIILCNSSCYGPVYPFAELFDAMKDRASDFWGLYRHPGLKDGRLCVPPHLQSYFLVLRKRLFLDPCFREYFSGHAYAASWEDAVKQETSFTGYFEERGFASASYLGQALSEYIEDPTVFMPSELLGQRFPFIKRKCLTTDYGYINKISSAAQIHELLGHLRKSPDYPVDLIYEDLLESQQNSHLFKVLGLNYVLESRRKSVPESESSCSVAAVIYSSRPENIDTAIGYLTSLPEGSAVFIVTSSEKVRHEWLSRQDLPAKYRTEIRLQEKGLGAEAAYWLTCRDVSSSFDFICLLNDPEGRPSDPPLKDRFFSDHCFSALLFSKEYVLNIIKLFQDNERLGLLMPFVPMFAEWPDRTLNDEWGGSREAAGEIFSMLRLSVPFDDHPVAPWGGMFWIRGKSMAALYRHDWKEENFPADSAGKAGNSFAGALLRMYPVIEQESGFLSGCVCPSDLAGYQFSNLYSNLQKYSAVGLDSSHVHFSDVKKVLGLYLRRKLRKLFGSRK